MSLRIARSLLAVVVLGMGAPSAIADEGMWLPNAAPVKQIKKAYGVDVDAAWLLKMQRSAVRFDGASGSFVSSSGLVMTNHHVGSDAIAKLSSPERDILTNGFYARTRDQELKCPDMELSVLWDVKDVTARVSGAAKEGMSPGDAGAARRGEMARIEKEAEEGTDLSAEVVTLYHGARYHLYLYKRFTDVRLVFCPEQQAAFFGGDNDNFEYPRFNYDVTFFRVYENGQPYKPENYLAWSAAGSKENELAFVFGHPGSTRRLYTIDHLKFRRDVEMPWMLRRVWRREIQLGIFRTRNEAQSLMAAEDFFGVANGRKRSTWQYAGLLDPELWNSKVEAERRVLASLEANPSGKAKWADGWDAISKAQADYRVFFRRWALLNQDSSWGWSRLLTTARHISRLADELPRPSDQRLREYRDSNLDKLYLDLYSPAPIHDALEIDRLASGLEFMAENLGADDPLVKSLFGGKSPRDRATELVLTTKLKGIDERKRLVDGGIKAVNDARDPMLDFIRIMDPEARRLRKDYEDKVEAVERSAYAKVAGAWFDLMGDDMYPDATGTLRITFGAVKGYTDTTPKELGGEGVVPAFTPIGGMFERAEKRKFTPPFDLPERWSKGKAALKLDTPFNFVLTADIIGGNSGSPVVNRAGEVTGLIFDSNIHHLVSDFVYEPKKGRAVAVDSRGIVEVLRKLYDAGALADELGK